MERNEVNSQAGIPSRGTCGGKMIILSVFALAILSTAFAVWYRHQQHRRALELWGSDSAMLIRYSSKMELLRLEETPSADAAAEKLTVAGQTLAIVQSQDVAGMVKIEDVRKGLIYDASFAWDEGRGDCRPQWRYALRFSDDQGQAVVVFDFACGRALNLDSGQEASIGPIFKSVKRIFEGQMNPASLPAEAPK